MPSLFEQIDAIRASAYAQWQREQAGLPEPVANAPTTVPVPLRSIWSRRLNLLSWALVGLGLAATLVSLAVFGSATAETIGRGTGFAVLGIGALALLVRWRSPGSASRGALIINSLLYLLVAWTFLSNDLRFVALPVVVIIWSQRARIHRTSLAAMRQHELVRLRAGQTPSPPLARDA
jgi:hypothetical protein